MKYLVRILVGIAAVVVVMFSTIFFLTHGMANTADKFFAALQTKDYADAYGCLSDDSRASTQQAELVQFLAKSSLLRIKGVSWKNRSIDGNRGQFDGVVALEDGGLVPLSLSFIKENDQWLIYSIYKPSTDPVNIESASLPSESERVALAMESMTKFASSVKARDFSEFHKYSSHVWQREVTVDKINAAFKSFIDNNVTVLPADNIVPVIDGTPSIDANGILSIKGHYPAKQSNVMFELGYVYEGVNWKLIQTSVNVRSQS
ncbi:MAG: hypothetical protein HY308_12690 [Gammaproteobacteria bacterium]|nr:hypothetical protein [Gammaproteobacteria bacterium]